MDKRNVVRALDEIARYLELQEPNPFKAQAFQRAARRLESQEGNLADLAASGELYKLPGIGKGIGPVIAELLDSGRSQYLEDLRGQYPPGIFELLRVPGLGLKKVGVLHSSLGIGSLEDLEQACREGKLAKLRGFGAKTQQKILEGIELARTRESRLLLPSGLELAELLRERLAAIDEIENVEIAGSIRRRLEVVRNVNLVVATQDRAAALEGIRALALFDEIEPLEPDTVRGTATNAIEVLFHFTDSEDFGSTLLRTTGAPPFVDAFLQFSGCEFRGNALFARGKRLEASSEEQLFEKAGVSFVEPERRESEDDLRLKKRRTLVALPQLRGTFHVHTTFSDGRNTVLEMLEAARDRGLRYVGISDHSKAAYYAGGLTEEQLPGQHAEIERQERAVAPLRVFRGTEADILPDGSIDYGNETLEKLDFVVASVHSRFNMPKEEMTERVLRALDNPYVTFLGHLTGRLLLSRDGYALDLDRIFDKAAERGVMIEINGNPRRLELDWRHIKHAAERGVRFSIHPDAHSIREYGALQSGIWVARKGGLAAEEIFNTQDVETISAYLAQRKERARGALAE